MKRIISSIFLILIVGLLFFYPEPNTLGNITDVINEYKYDWGKWLPQNYKDTEDKEEQKNRETDVKEADKGKYPLEVHFLDVGQADSTFLELPDGKTMLIDAGNSENAEDIIAFIEDEGYDKIDYVVSTHPHSDHIGGMTKVLKRFETGKLFMPKKEHTSKAFENMLDVIEKKEIPLYSAKKGAVIAQNDMYEINILSPEEKEYDDLNNYSAVVMLSYGDTRFLFMGDAERLIETPLKKLDIRADVLKLGHHGSSTSSGEQFLKMVNPDYCIISCGKDNSYGHPHEEVIKRLERLGINYGRTDYNGTISVYADDGKNFEIVKECSNDN